MGRGYSGGRGSRRSNARGGGGGGRGGGRWGERGNGEGKWTDAANLTNEGFEQYYGESGLVPKEEWEAFLKSMRSQLPVTFRINGGSKHAFALRDTMEADLFSKLGSAASFVNDDGTPATKPFALPWYPDRLAWQLGYSRSMLRKIPVLSEIHAFVVRENDKGNLTRQEAVSMVPPLMLDVQAGDRVLDMCAAPGSKTFQMLEAIHKGGLGKPTDGIVIANDADAQRCGLLTHQTARMSSANMIVCQHEGQEFPTLYDSGGGKYLFDRILADVPCTGDGTLRKAPDIWARWNHNQALGIHPLQARITIRGCEMLKVGGTLVYSTCSINPIEDEAVLAQILRETGYAMELQDVSDRFPALKRCPGVSTWTVNDRNGRINSYEEGRKAHHDHKRISMIRESHFPPTKEEAEKMQLHKAMRFLPHHNDTGGFFVAVLKKVREISKHKEQEGAAAKGEGEGAGGSAEPAQKRAKVETASGQVLGRETGRRQHRGVDPIVMVTAEKVHSQLTRFFGIEPSMDLSKSLIARNLDAELPKRIYYISDASRRILESDPAGKMKVIATGVKLFERQEAKDADPDNACSYRICQEGLYLLLPHMSSKQVVTMPLMELRKLLHARSVRKESFIESVQDQFKRTSLGKGCVIAKLVASENDNLKDGIFEAGGCAVACWMGDAALSLLCDKNYAAMVLEKLGGAPPQDVLQKCIDDKAKAKATKEATEAEALLKEAVTKHL